MTQSLCSFQWHCQHWPHSIHWKYLAGDGKSNFSAQPSASYGCVCLWRRGKQPSFCDDRGDIALRLLFPLLTLLSAFYWLIQSWIPFVSVIKNNITCVLQRIHLAISASEQTLPANSKSLWTSSPLLCCWMTRLLLLCSDMTCPFTSGLRDGDCHSGTLAFVSDS